jgi:hypothetical protein
VKPLNANCSVGPLASLVFAALLLPACVPPSLRVAGDAMEMPTLAQQQMSALSWLHGEWDNHAQVEAARQAGTTLPPRVHLLYAWLDLPGKERWLLTQHSESTPSQVYQSRVYQNRLYRLESDVAAGALRLERYRPADDAVLLDLHRDPQRQQGLQLSLLQADPGCSFKLEFDVQVQGFQGSTQPGACSERNGASQALINTSLHFNAQALHLEEAVVVAGGTVASTDLHTRKVRYFDGWAVIHRDGARADPAAGDGFRILRTLRLFDQGNRFELRWDDGKPTGYSLELAQLDYAGEVGTVLRLALLEDRTGRTLAYAWANPDASRIGLNIGWFQSGFTLKDRDAAIGWR